MVTTISLCQPLSGIIGDRLPFVAANGENSTGKKLAKAREALVPKPSQYDVAEMFLGDRKFRARVAAWESNRNTPDTAVVRQIAEAWGIPLAWFYDEQDTPVPTPTRPPRIVREAIQPYNAPGSDPPGPSSHRAAQPGVGRRAFPVLGRAGAALVHLDSPEASADDWMDFSDELYDRHRDQFVVKVWGDSAERDMSHGDWVLVTKEPGFRLRGYFVVVKNTEHEFLVKVLAGTVENPEFHSVNAEYPPIKAGEGAEMVGYVCGWKRDRGLGQYSEVGGRDGLKPGFRD